MTYPNRKMPFPTMDKTMTGFLPMESEILPPTNEPIIIARGDRDIITPTCQAVSIFSFM